MSLKSVGIYAAIVVATLIGGEMVARMWDWRASGFEGSAGDSYGSGRYYHSYSGAGDLAPSQDGHWVIWFHRPYHVQTNSVGLRNTEEPSDSAFRIYAIGDSQTFGPYLGNEDTWPAWTENALRQHYRDGKRVQVFNAGIAGYTISDELALLKEKGVAFKPGLVVLGVFENDLLDLRKAAGQRPQSDPQSRLTLVLKSLARDSALVSMANQVKTRMQMSAANVDITRGEGTITAPGRAQVLDREALERRYSDLFRETVNLLRSNNIGFAVVFIPAADMKDDESLMKPLIETLTRETATPYLDLTPALRAKPDSDDRHYLVQREAGGAFTGNSHLSREGNAEIGRAVAGWLVERGLVPK